jgi:hypothetical protein
VKHITVTRNAEGRYVLHWLRQLGGRSPASTTPRTRRIEQAASPRPDRFSREHTDDAGEREPRRVEEATA